MTVDEALEHADKRLDSDCRTLAAERDELRAMLEPTPDALELVNHLFGVDSEMYIKYSPMYIKVLQQQNDAAQLIAAHDARLLDEAAERAVAKYEQWHGRTDRSQILRAAVRGEVEK